MMRRAKQDIVFDMLRAIQEKGGTIKPTHLLYKSNLSHSRMKELLSELTEKKLVENRVVNEHGVLVLTEQGYEFLSKWQQLKAFTEAFGL